MSKLLPSLNSTELIKFFRAKGFQKKRQKGSHAFFEHLDGRKTVIPIHKGKDISIGTLKAILEDANFTPQDFLNWKYKKR